MFPPLYIPSVGYPAVGDVRLGTAVANGFGTLNTSGSYAAATDVRNGVDRGDGTLGTLTLPARTYVDNSQTYDGGTVGDLLTPTVDKVLTTVAAYGPGAGTSGGLAGTYRAPSTAQVQSGVTFGPLSALVGTYGGSGSVTGPGADQITVTLSHAGQPIDGANVWITNDGPGATVIAGTLVTDASGQATFLLTAGSTYYLWAEKEGWNGIRGQSFVAAAD